MNPKSFWLFLFTILSYCYARQNGLSMKKSMEYRNTIADLTNSVPTTEPKLFENVPVVSAHSLTSLESRIVTSNEYFLILISILTGSLTSSLVMRSKVILAGIMQWSQLYKWSPLLGGLIVSILCMIDGKIATNPFNMPLATRSSKDSCARIQPNLMYDQWKRLASPQFSVIRQILRLIGSIVAVGSGLSLGSTACTVEIGMTIAYLFGLLLPYAQPTNAQSIAQSNDNDTHRKYLLLAGAAAGIASNSNGPFTGALYSLEIANNMLSTSMSTSSESSGNKGSAIKSTVLIMAVTAAVITLRIFTSPKPALVFSSNLDFRYLSSSVDKIPAFIAIGLMGGSLSHLFTISREHATKAISSTLSTDLLPFRPLIGGLVPTLAAYTGYSQLMSRGYRDVNSMLSGEFSNTMELFKFLVIKLISTIACISTSPVGGLVAPSLFVGSTLGALFYHTLAPYYSNLMLDSVTVYIFLGAAAFLSSIFKAPLTASMMIAEMMGSQTLLVPLLITATVSAYVSQKLPQLQQQYQRRSNR